MESDFLGLGNLFGEINFSEEEDTKTDLLKMHKDKSGLITDEVTMCTYSVDQNAKIITFRLGDDFYTVECSGENNNFEQFTIDNDEDLFNFTKNYIQKIKMYFESKKELNSHGKIK